MVAGLLVTGLAVPGWMLGAPGPADIAQRAASAYTKNDVAAGNAISCEKMSPQQVREKQKHADASGTRAEVTVVGEPTVTGDTATARLAATATSGDHAGQRITIKLRMREKDGAWCVAGAEPTSAHGG